MLNAVSVELVSVVLSLMFGISDYYIDLNNSRVNGQIRYVNAKEIIFSEPGSSEEIKLTPFDILGFRSDNKEYIVIDSLTIQSRVLLVKKTYEKVFVEKVLTGKIELYKLDHVLKGWATEWYYYVQKGNGELIAVPFSSNKDFRRFMLSILKDRSEIVEHYENNRWKIRDLEALVYMYNMN